MGEAAALDRKWDPVQQPPLCFKCLYEAWLEWVITTVHQTSYTLKVRHKQH